MLRAYGATVNMFRLMMKISDSNLSSFIWYWTLNRWISARFNLLSSVVVGVTGVVCLISGASAASTGFALSFAGTVSGDLLFVVRRFVALEQSMVSIERIVETTELPVEAPEYIEPRPPASWPSQGALEVEKLVIKYAPELPNVLHGISFRVEPRQKVGIVGATGGSERDREANGIADSGVSTRLRQINVGFKSLPLRRAYGRRYPNRWAGHYENWPDRPPSEGDHYPPGEYLVSIHLNRG